MTSSASNAASASVTFSACKCCNWYFMRERSLRKGCTSNSRSPSLRTTRRRLTIKMITRAIKMRINHVAPFIGEQSFHYGLFDSHEIGTYVPEFLLHLHILRIRIGFTCYFTLEKFATDALKLW